jgi:hypothetical protein
MAGEMCGMRSFYGWVGGKSTEGDERSRAFQVLKREGRHTVTKLWRTMYGGESGKLPVPA